MRLGKAIKDIAYWGFIAGAFAFAAAESTCDRFLGETLVENLPVGNGAVCVWKQRRMINRLPLYRVVALDEKYNALYESTRPFELSVPARVEKAKKALESSL